MMLNRTKFTATLIDDVFDFISIIRRMSSIFDHIICPLPSLETHFHTVESRLEDSD